MIALNRLLLLFLLLIFSNFSLSQVVYVGVWQGYGKSHANVNDTCADIWPHQGNCTSGGYETSTAQFDKCITSKTASCKFAEKNCSTGGSRWIENVGVLTFACASPRVVVGTCPNLSCQCPNGEENGVCVSQCTAPKVKNPYTGQCQDPCQTSDWSGTGVYMPHGTYFSPEPLTNCSNHCEYQHKIDHGCIMGEANNYFCVENEILSKATGNFCGDDTPATSNPPTSCEAGYELYNGSCIPSECPDGSPRLEDKSCLPLCPNGFERVGANCMRRCEDNEVRAPVTLICQSSCPANTALFNGQCVPTSCPDNQYLQNGRCEDRPTNPNCGEGEVSNAQGQCLPNCPNQTDALVNGQCVPTSCPDGQALVNGSCKSTNPLTCPSGMRPNKDNTACVTLECADGQRVSYLLNKCVPDESAACPSGQHKEGLVCVPDKSSDCKAGTTFISGCGCKPDGMDTTAFCQAGRQTGPPTDIDSDGIPNKSDPDIDGDGTPNESDPDKDGDGIPNNQDTTPAGPDSKPTVPEDKSPDGDYDGDGIPNKLDPDKDGDGIPNDKDPTPDGSSNNKSGQGQCDPATQDCSDRQGKDSPGAPAGQPGNFYESRSRKFSDVFNDFQSRLAAAPIVSAGRSFFSLSPISGNCPVWTLPQTAFNESITISFQCSEIMISALRIAGSLVVLVAAWIAIRIALIEG